MTTGDVVTALEANRRASRGAVLRVTPPFYGRMRARIHLEGAESADYDDPKPLHIDPESFVTDGAPTYPEVDETRPDPYDVDEHHERHQTAVEAWRRSIRRYLRDTVDVPAPSGPHTVEAKYLG